MPTQTLTAPPSFLNLRVLKELLWVGGGQYFGAGLSLLATIFAAHALTVEDFGLLSIFVATMTLTTEITGKSLDWSVVRFCSFYLEQAPVKAHILIRKVLGVRLLLAVAVCVFGCLSTGLLADRIFRNPGYRAPIAMGFLGAIGMSMWGYGLAVLQAYQHFGLHSLISFLNGLAKLVAVFALIALGLCRSEWVQAAYVAVAFGTLAIVMLSVPKEFLHVQGTGAGLMGRFFHFSKWPFAANLFVMLYTYQSFFFLLYFAGPGEVAVYSSAWRLVFALDLLAYSLIVVFLPKASRITNTSAFLSYAVQTLKVSLPACALLICLVFHSGTIMTALYPDGYSGGTLLLQILLVGTLVALPAHPISLIILAANRPGVFALVSLAVWALSLTGGLLIIPAYAGLGAALVTALTKALYGILLLAFSYMAIRKPGRAIKL